MHYGDREIPYFVRFVMHYGGDIPYFVRSVMHYGGDIPYFVRSVMHYGSDQTTLLCLITHRINSNIDQFAQHWLDSKCTFLLVFVS